MICDDRRRIWISLDVQFGNANRPAARNTSSPSRTARAARQPECQKPLSTAVSHSDAISGRHSRPAGARASRRGRGERIAQEQRTPRRRQSLAELHRSSTNLPVAVVLCADLDRAPREAPAIGKDPHGHRAVASQHDAVGWDAGRAHWLGRGG